MKKIFIGCIAVTLIAGCGAKNQDGTYVATGRNQYSIIDDTIIIKEGIIINRVGFRKIIKGKLMPKAWRVKSWRVTDLDAPVIQLSEHHLTINATIYQKIEP